MNAYPILALLILGHLCQIQAATLNKPSKNGDALRKQLVEKILNSLADEREDHGEALKALKTSLSAVIDETDEQSITVIAILIAAGIAGGLIGGAAGGAATSAVAEAIGK
uniref:Glycine rich superfamily member n=1 Tax=Rhipicephalus appendiculatus TaxID=34631 RepID=A0A131YEP3_RHIAP